MNNRIERESERIMTQLTTSSNASADTTDVLASIWRYRWAVILPGLAGMVIGLLLFLTTEETFRSTTRLMVESDRPAMLDKMSGDIYGGVPAIEIVESYLFSDSVVEIAFNHEEMKPFQENFQNRADVFHRFVQKSLVLDPEVEDLRTAQSLVALLHYDSPDRELCKVAVQAFSKALQEHFNKRQKNTRDEVKKLIQEATDQLLPRLRDYEDDYINFRRDSGLAWNSKGEAINPYRERQMFLTQRRSELSEKKRHSQIELRSVQSIVDQASDPLLAFYIVGQLLNKRFVLPVSGNVDPRQIDNLLAQIELDETLVPLMIERNKYEAEFGPNHPTVKALDAELLTMKNELKRLVEERIKRIVELRPDSDPNKPASDAVNAIVSALSAEVQVLQEQIFEIDKQIDEEKYLAAQLAEKEHQNFQLLRKIDQTRDLYTQLEEQLARIDLMEDESGTRVVELTKPSAAYAIAPSLVRYLGLGSLLGLALGVGIALLLEKNANTFRDPDEISTMLGVAVLTHVPYFRKRTGRSDSKSNPYQEIDPGMAVLHAPASVAAEAIRSLRTSVFFETAGEGGKIIQVTSPLPGDGKTTIAGNLACSIAQSGKRVLVIDCDLRRPQMTDNFSMTDKIGLTNVLNGDCDPVEACHATPLHSLFVMPSGPIPANPAEALTLPEMGELLEDFRKTYDFIILDTPPLLVVTDPSIIASMTDGVVLSVRVRRKSKPNARESVNILRAVGARILGVVVNNSDDVSSSDGYRGQGYYRYGRYSERYKVKGSLGKTSGKVRSSRMVVSGGASSSMRQSPAMDAKANGHHWSDSEQAFQAEENESIHVD